MPNRLKPYLQCLVLIAAIVSHSIALGNDDCNSSLQDRGHHYNKVVNAYMRLIFEAGSELSNQDRLNIFEAGQKKIEELFTLPDTQDSHLNHVRTGLSSLRNFITKQNYDTATLHKKILDAFHEKLVAEKFFEQSQNISKQERSAPVPNSLVAETHFVGDFAMSRDGKWIAISAYRNSILMWNTFSGQKRQIVAKAKTMFVGMQQALPFQIEFSPDGNLLAAEMSADDGSSQYIVYFNTNSGKEVFRFVANQSNLSSKLDRAVGRIRGYNSLPALDKIGRFKISNDGKTILTGSMNSSLWIRDFQTGKPVQKLNSNPNPFKVQTQIDSISLSPDEKTLITTHEDLKVKIWDWERKKVKKTLASPDPGEQYEKVRMYGIGMVYVRTYFSPDQQVFILQYTVGSSASLHAFDSNTLERLYATPYYETYCHGLAISNDGRYFVTLNKNYEFEFYESRTGSFLSKYKFPQKGNLSGPFPNFFQFSPDGKSLYVATSSEGIFRLSIQQGPEGIPVPVLEEEF